MKQSSLAITIGLILGSQVVYANPEGAQVVQGSATFSNPSSTILNINNSRNAIINWQSFNIGAGQTTRFIQPSSSSSVLNRVVSNNPSQILGQLSSNGRVFLINQHGILVGEGATINTSGFFGSTLNITDTDYLNGKLNFNGGGLGNIKNQGYIHAGEDGSIVLIAPNIENGGVIEVENGNIILAAGKSITITSLENSSIQFEVSSAENKITNLGQVIAHNGAAGLFAGTLQHSGSIRASGVVQNADGSISLVTQGDLTIDDNAIVSTDGTTGGDILVQSEQGIALIAGEVTAKGIDGTGGSIQLLGEYVGVSGDAKIDASGVMGGGQILVGGDYQGANADIQNSKSTFVGEKTQIHADALESGNGGRVILWSDEATRSFGEITAKGGASGGDGGFIETSGRYLELGDVAPDVSASNGGSGTWLIDPEDIRVTKGGANTSQTGSGDPGPVVFTPAASGGTVVIDPSLIETALDNGSNVELDTTGGSTGAGNISILAAITKSADGGNGNGSTLTLNAHNNIYINADITSTVGVLNLTLNPDQDGIGGGIVNFDTGFDPTRPLTVDTNGGNLTVNGNSIIGGESSFALENTDWVIQSNHQLTIEGYINPPLAINLGNASSLINNGELALDSATITGSGLFQNNGKIVLNGFSTASSTIDTTSLNFVNTGAIHINGMNDLTLTGGQLSLLPNTSLTGGGTINSNVTLSGGSITGGTGYSSYGLLTINGMLTVNSGLVHLVIGKLSTDWESNSIFANTISINGGDLIMAWDTSVSAEGVRSDPLSTSSTLSLLSCSTLGCITNNGFTSVTNPLLITNSNLSVGTAGNGDALEYSVVHGTDVDVNANIFSWSGGGTTDNWNDANNWLALGNSQLPVVPTAADYVFVDNVSALMNVTISDSQAVAGLQSAAVIKIEDGGTLTLNGDGFFIQDGLAGSGELTLAGNTATLAGTGVLYALPGTVTHLNQGVLAKDMVNWGTVVTTANTAFQVDRNLSNFGIMDITDKSGTNTITGTGSLYNFGLMKVATNFDTNIQFDNKRSGFVDIGLAGIDFSLTGSSILNGTVNIFSGSVLSLSGGNHTFADGMSFNGDLNVTSGVVDIEGGMTIDTLNLSGSQLNIDTLGASSKESTLKATTFNWGSAATISGGGTGVLNIASSDTLLLLGTTDHVLNDISVVHDGKVDVTAASNRLMLNNTTMTSGTGATIAGLGTLDLQTGSNWIISTAGQIMPANMTLDLNGGSITNAQNLTLANTFNWLSGTVNGTGSGLTSSGHVTIQTGVLNTDWTISPTGTVEWLGDNTDGFVLNDAVITNNGQFTVKSSLLPAIGTSIGTQNKGLSSTGISEFINNNLLLIDGTDDVVTFGLPFTNDGTIGIASGTFRIENASGDSVPLVLEAGESLQGFGTFDGDVINQAGMVSPGRSNVSNDSIYETGSLTITGDYTQGVNGQLLLEMDSTTNGLEYDALNVEGLMTAGGAIDFRLINGVTVIQLAALINQTFTPLTRGSFSGKFANVNIPKGLNFTLGDDGLITISSDVPLLNKVAGHLNDVANQLGILLSRDDLDFSKMVRVMKFMDRRSKIMTNTDGDEKRRIPRLVCK